MPATPKVPWQAFFTEGALQEAEEYVSQGLVGALEEQGGVISGEVRERRRQFHPELLLIAPVVGTDGILRVEDLSRDCACARGRLGCSHGAAVLLAFSRFQELTDPGLDERERSRLALTLGVNSSAGSQLLAPEPAGAKPLVSASGRVLRPISAGEPAMPVLARRFLQVDHPVQELESWLHRHFQHRSQQPEHILTYHLHAPSDEPGAASPDWTLELVAARRLKSGALGLHKRFRNVSDALDLGASNLQREDQQLLNLLDGLLNVEGRWQGRVVLDARQGATGDLLERIIATSRAYAEDFAHPLTRGAALVLHPAWVQQEQLWRLELRDADHQPWPLVPVQPPWYISDGRAGPTTAAVSDAQLSALATMPPIHASHLATVMARLAREMPALPAPPTTLAPLLPHGHLVRVRLPMSWRLPDATDAWPAGERSGQVEAVCFLLRYGSLFCAPGGTGALMDEAGEPVLRDPFAEQALSAQLEQLGLVPISELPAAYAAKIHATVPGPSPGRIHLSSLAAGASGDVPPMVLGALVAGGWSVTGAGAPVPEITAADIEARFEESAPGARTDWFQLALGVRFGAQRVDLTPVLTRLLEFGEGALAGLPRIVLAERTWVCLGLGDGTVVRVPLDLLTQLVEHLLALYDRAPSAQGWETDPWQALALQGIHGLAVEAGPRLQTLVERLKRLRSPVQAELPPGFTGELRGYQRAGLAWMTLLRAAGSGGILADDMGLGKTVQAISHLCSEHAAGHLEGPALVVGPASMVGTWRRELARFAPGLRVLVQHGTQRPRQAAALSAVQVVITTYATLLRDAELVGSITWSMIIADEAQFMANPTVKSGQVLRSLRSPGRLALTGTPLSNHLGELHTLMQWVVPGLLGSAHRFDISFRKPIEDRGDAKRAELLRARIAPFLLRRTKEAVAPELPPRTESIVTLALEGSQRALYEGVRLAMDARIREVVAAKGLARSRIEVFEALTTLRMCCCDPRLVKLPGLRAGLASDQASAKLDWLLQTLPQLIEEGRRILLFSQFTSWLDLVESDVTRPLGLSWVRLDGSTRDREVPVRRFQDGMVPVFLLSLKAGGTGLTLTAADTVIISDPWWNPAAEAQAADRAHRIGQDKPVFIYRLVTQDTVEERILTLQARKRALMASMLDVDGQAVPKLSDEDLSILLSPLPE